MNWYDERVLSDRLFESQRKKNRSMIKSLVMRFFTLFSEAHPFSNEDQESIVHRQQNIKLKSSMQERLKATQEWSRAENIVKRIEEQRTQASGALERAQRMKEVLATMSKEDYSEYNKFLVDRPDKAWRVK